LPTGGRSGYHFVKPVKEKFCFPVVALFSCILFASCATTVETQPQNESALAAAVSPPAPPPSADPSPGIPNLRTELLDDRDKATDSPIGTFDFKNFTYELPRGWQNPDGTTDFTLTGGKIAPVEGTFSDDMSDEEKADIRQRRRIGMSYVTTKYLDMTGDGEDEAVVILKVETGGSAIPQLAYVFQWKDGGPNLIWPFRTGDRADGGLKDIRVENGLVVVELYGQDRFVLGQTETGKITGDRVQLCCPTHFTRSFYRWNGKDFLLSGKRLTYLTADLTAPPEENLGEIVNAPAKGKK
jgi:hypothetical protein